jgi:ubiquinone/menaquinone biosynthesis C-methylase UbiE
VWQRRAYSPLILNILEKFLLNTNNSLISSISKLEPWYHRIDLGEAIITPGDRNQALTFSLYETILGDLTNKTVLDLGANACGLSIEFAQRGAIVTAIEINDLYIEQAKLVIDHMNLASRITIHKADIHEMMRFGNFDIVSCLGILYHLRHPQLALDQLSHVAKEHLLISSQTKEGDSFTMTSRSKQGTFAPRWEPTEPALFGMLNSAGFRDVRLLSTKPHIGECSGSILGNRSYFYAKAFKKTSLPFVS